MTPLEKARSELNKPKEICCKNCNSMVIVKNLAYCEISEKIIMPIHLDVRRDKQCEDNFKERKGGIRIETRNNISSNI